jgi:hypothetical protein
MAAEGRVTSHSLALESIPKLASNAPIHLKPLMICPQKVPSPKLQVVHGTELRREKERAIENTGKQFFCLYTLTIIDSYLLHPPVQSLI